MRSLRALACLCAIAVGLTILPLAPARADDVSISDPAAMSDLALIEALEAAEMLDAWIMRSPHAPESSVLKVRGGAEHDAAQADLEEALWALADLRTEHREYQDELNRLQEMIDRLDTVVRQLRRDELRPDSGPGDVNASGKVERAPLVRQNDDPPAPASLASELELLQRDIAQALVDALGGVDDKDAHTQRWNAFLERLTPLRSRLLAQRMVSQVAVLEDAEHVDDVEVLIDRLHNQRGAASTAVAGIPLVTLDAYVVGASFVSDGCPVDWAMLAGIGRVESIHGTLGGASVAGSGAVAPSIFGPLLDGGATAREAEEEAEAARAAAEAEAERLAAEAAAIAQAEEERRRSELYGLPVEPTPTPDPAILAITGGDTADSDGDDADEDGEDADDSEDGEEEEEEQGNGFAVIVDSDDGVLDGNAAWDRAVGPMQFLPGTWRLWSTDGNGDGDEDPHNLYDAAAGAARYLCHLARRSGPSPTVFILGYNASSAYVARVLSFADDYRRSLPIVSVDTESGEEGD